MTGYPPPPPPYPPPQPFPPPPGYSPAPPFPAPPGYSPAPQRPAGQPSWLLPALILGAVASLVTLALCVAGVAWVVFANTASKPAAPTRAASCGWTPLSPPLPNGVKDVGMPPASGEPRSGVQTLTITTNLGVIKVPVDTAKTPCTAASFTHLASRNFYDNTTCHRLVDGDELHVLQCGDPSGTSAGGPAYQYGEENLPVGQTPAYPEGVLAMAKTQQPKTTGGQFFVVFKDTELPADYTVVGKVTEGLDIVKKVADAGIEPGGYGPTDGKPKLALTITSISMS